MPGSTDLPQPHKGDEAQSSDTSGILHRDAAVRDDEETIDRDAAVDRQRDDDDDDDGPRGSTAAAGRPEGDDDEDIPPICTRLMLSAELLGAEAGQSFAQLYTIPNLQSLGMPISQVSLMGLISGPLAIVLLPFVGWCSDNGANPSRRRAITVIIAAAILASGALTVITTNIIHTHSCIMDFGNSERSLISNGESNGSNTVPQQIRSTDCFPAAKGLAMLGYILMELGYDTGMSSIKTWMLTCNPPKGASSALVAGLVLTSFGGMLTAGLGMVDLPSVMGVDSVPPLALQTTVQATVVVIAVAAGMVISLLTGHQLLRQRQQCLNSVHITAIIDHPRGENGQASVGPNRQGAVAKVAASSELSENNADVGEIEIPNQKTFQALGSRDNYQEYISLPTNPARSYGTQQSNAGRASSSESVQLPQDDRVNSPGQMLLEEDSSYSKRSSCCTWRRRFGFKLTIGIMWFSAYFGVGAITVTVLMSSDFVGKAIYGGDPTAPLRSEAKHNYKVGLRMASYGVLVNYGVYLAFSFVQKRVLAFMGYTLEMVIMTLLLSISLVVVALTQRMDMYFLMTAVSGVHKAVFHVVPLSVASDLLNYEAQHGNDSLKMGGAMSLIVMGLPVAYLTLYPWVGTVIDVTGVLATPLLLAALYGVLSAMLFLTLGI